MADTTHDYCDLVMKGGITSGLVYPNAAVALSKRYRFKNVGGTSAGAIAASACAAAALGQRLKDLTPEALTESGGVGFAGLEQVAATLMRPGFLYTLFQPGFGARSVFRMVVRLAARQRLGAIVQLAAVLAWTAGLEACLVFAAILAMPMLWGGRPGIELGVLAALAALGVAVGLGIMRVATTIRRNLMGLCTGMSSKRWFGRDRPALTEWLHGVIQAVSGRDTATPLLFEDLWQAPRYPGEPATEKALTLRMITTAVSHHEPRSLPLEPGSGRFWFLAEQFRKLFPAAVVDWMIGEDPAPVTSMGTTFYRLPEGGRLPVIVGARMSLSFPILISAVPLHEPDFRGVRRPAETRSADGADKPRIDAADDLTSGGAAAGHRIGDGTLFRVCWFSDGGISSNFPIHLFDSPLPRWPTFAIDLVYRKQGDGVPEAVSLPQSNNQGWRRRYEPIERRWAASEIAAFLFGIIATMQNWRDILLARAPGQRERIVSVPLAAGEGGLNLNMPAPVLDAIAAKGTLAGETLVAQFDFANHWWIRWRNVAATGEQFCRDLAEGAVPPISSSYAQAFASAKTGEPAPPSYRFTKAQAHEGAARFATLTSLGQNWGTTTPSLIDGAPRPQPKLVITPIY